MKKLSFILLSFSLILTGCGSSPKQDASTRPFPEVKVPSILSGDEANEYALDHFWDTFLAPGEYLCDSTHIEGVEDKIAAAHLASYLSILENYPLEQSAPRIEAFFGAVEARQKADTLSNVFPWALEAVGFYLFDPVSDIRDEDLYLPFVTRLLSSDLLPEGSFEKYERQLEVCSTNRKGTPAPDFQFIDARGNTRRLYDSKAQYTILAFINPGCNACGEVVATFGTKAAETLVAAGMLDVVAIYIDEDVEAWREKLSSVPPFWISGHEPSGIIRDDNLYYVRAIPSVYLLDSDKQIIMKDAPVSKVAQYIRY